MKGRGAGIDSARRLDKRALNYITAAIIRKCCFHIVKVVKKSTQNKDILEIQKIFQEGYKFKFNIIY